MPVVARQLLSLGFLMLASESAGALTDLRAADFVRALIRQRDQLTRFVHPGELALSNRLGIRYVGVDHKFLISYDLGSALRESIDVERVQHRIETVEPERGVARLILSIPGARDSLAFLFEDSLLISPFRYHTGGWMMRESAHVRYYASDSSSLRDYHLTNLERFFETAASILALSREDRAVLADGKINYYLCANDEEVRQLTGHTTLGMYNLAYDAIVTSYHAHYHELVHLLVNVKLRHLPLYTHSLLQEGLAVAIGGRGGKDPGPILELGQFLCGSGMVDYRTLCSDSTFDGLDPSMSYPVAGLYSAFLLETMGLEPYLDLYRRHSGAVGEVATWSIAVSELPSDSTWKDYLELVSTQPAIQTEGRTGSGRTVLETPTAKVTQSGDRYFIVLRDTLLLQPDEAWHDFRNALVTQMIGQRTYGGERYAVVADAQEISVYNLHTGNLAAKCVGGFLDPPATFTQTNGRYSFSVRKDVFDEDL